MLHGSRSLQQVPANCRRASRDPAPQCFRTRLAQRQQRLVDGGPLCQALALRPRHLLPLRARQVHKAQQAAPHAHCHGATPAAATAGAGHTCCQGHSQLDTALQQGQASMLPGCCSTLATCGSGGAEQRRVAAGLSFLAGISMQPSAARALICVQQQQAAGSWQQPSCVGTASKHPVTARAGLACSTMWERLLAAFMRVAAVCRLAAARSSSRSTSPTAGHGQAAGEQ